MILAFTSMVALAFGGWVAVQAMEHTERLAMIRRGIVPPPQGPRFMPVTPLPNPIALLYLQRAIALGCAAFIVLLCLAFVVCPLP